MVNSDMEFQNSPVESVVRFLHKLVSRPVDFVIETELSDAEVIERLHAIVEPRRNSIVAALMPTNRLFAGEVSPQGFKIMRNTGDGGLPVIIGHFEPGPKGARVCVTMRLTRAASFLRQLFLFIFVVLLAIAALQRNAAAMSLIVAICLVAAWAITRRESYEERSARVLLEETLQTRPSPRIQRILSGAAPRRIRGVVFLVGVGLIWLISQLVATLISKP